MQYAHTHKDSYSLPGTLVLTGTTKDHLHQLFTTHSTQLMMMLGLSIASPHDQFAKKTGREFANNRIAPIPAKFCQFSMEGTKHFYRFATEIKIGFRTYQVSFRLTTVAESDLVKLIDAEISEKTP